VLLTLAKLSFLSVGASVHERQRGGPREEGQTYALELPREGKSYITSV
jgi:hypothetical protein